MNTTFRSATAAIVTACAGLAVPLTPARAQEKPPPAVQQAGQLTESRFEAALIEHDYGRIMAAYKKLHPDITGAALATVEHMVRTTLVYHHNGPPTATAEDVEKAYYAVLDAKAADTFLGWLGSLPELDAKKFAAACVSAGFAYKELSEDAYPQDFMVWLWCSYAHLLPWDPQEGLEQEAIRMRGVEALARMVRDQELPDIEQRFLFKRFSRVVDGEVLAAGAGGRLSALLQEPGGKNPWLASALVGLWQVEAGWRERGTGTADKVSDTGWAGLERHLLRARLHLKRAWDQNPNHPEPAASMITVAMAGHAAEGETERLWFERARAAQFDYIRAYDAYRYSLQPKWGGSHEALLAFGRECADTERFDTRVPLQHFWVAVDIEKNMRQSGACWSSEYKVLKKVLQGYADHGLTEETRVRALSRLVALGFRVQRFDDARTALLALNGRPLQQDALESFGIPEVSEAELRLHVLARGSTAAGALERAIDAAGEENWPASAAAAGEAMALAGESTGETQLAIKGLALALRQRAEFMQGKEIVPGFEEGFPGWHVQGDWRAVGADAAAGVGTTTQDIAPDRLLYSVARFGTRYEMEFDLRFDPAMAGFTSFATVAFDLQPGNPKWLGWRFEFVASHGACRVAVHGRSRGNVPEVRPIPNPGRVKLQVWDEHALLEYNGKVVWRGLMPTLKGRHDEGDNLGFRTRDASEFSNIKIRLLKEQPAIMLAPPEAKPAPKKPVRTTPRAIPKATPKATPKPAGPIEIPKEVQDLHDRLEKDKLKRTTKPGANPSEQPPKE